MTVRFACEKDIPQMDSLLYQVERVHQQGRPDLFKEGAKKYTDNELKDMLKDKTKPIFAAVDENDVMKGYAFVGEKIVSEAEFMAQIVKNK